MSNKQNDNFADFVAEMFIDDGFSPKEATEMAYFAIDNDLKGKDEILDEWQKAKPQIRLDQEKDRTDEQVSRDLNPPIEPEERYNEAQEDAYNEAKGIN